MPELFNIRISGQKTLARINLKAIKNLRNKRPFFLSAVITLERWVKKNFQADGGLHKNKKFKWKRLSEATIDNRRKGKKQGSPQILRDTGALFGRWNRIATNKDGRLRSGVNYSIFHEKGSKKANLPQRKIFPTDAHLAEIIQPVLKKYVDRSIG